jgi:hypothetical protein
MEMVNKFADHFVHHVLALWALGASTSEIQNMWDYNKPYQAAIDRNYSAEFRDLDLSNPKLFDQCLGKDEHYLDFLRFFKWEIDRRGVPDTVREYLLKGDRRADDIFCRMYTGKYSQTSFFM